MAITSLVLGIISLCAFPLGPLAVLFGVIGLILIRRRPETRSGTGMAIAGIATGFVGCLVLAALIGPAVSAFRQGMMAQNGRPVTVEPAPYEPLIGKGFSGSGFHFDYNGNTYIAASLHQFDGDTPTSMLRGLFSDNESGAIIQISGRVHTQTDVQILEYDTDALANDPPLRYEPDVTLDPGHPVILLCGNGPVVAHMTQTTPDAENLVWARLKDRRYDLTGCSGSAVVSGETGTVVGVLIGSGLFSEMAFERLEPPIDLAGPQPD